MRMIRVASRKSLLAMTQTRQVIQQLQSFFPDTEFQIIPVVTQGDRILDVSLSKIGGKGLFVSEVEQQLLQEQADMAVHSLKDVPAELADGLVIAAYPNRVDARDALITKKAKAIHNLPQGSVIGTSSLRRMAQLKHLRNDLQIKLLRGNIDTRLNKLESGEYDAILLAAAGLIRMGWEDRITERIDPMHILPAIGQGILAVECRDQDSSLKEMLQSLHCRQTEQVALAERALLHSLNGGCQVPIAGYAEWQNGTLVLTGLVASEDGEVIYQVKESLSSRMSPVDLGQMVAKKLLEKGADQILQKYS
ncbi:hydroxymethylbilane synthase [Alicyclobacillus sp. TC]|uniref:hydroxymethylbilane synthase n=1 Tax=Alicyclobacillus sp. TC TaxID=2606450 RepID=UPI001932DE41|nr:hydroxymethylbilane synthase [Alicyclobacillus sp. TC]QRF23198.1 hydroxymethylbilane synthase [Alicyclobacillus sp. TC]